ncbi:hypothetical protein E1B28_001807 [Marasmius oreades]|uniref:Kinase-like protein n=1 Tax=Marasmius oreades TaxID=181124 RepID=A0A9P7V4C6_9AGAR|nr:uncharacterized protein E1B28_001807 [Marasmius oreades]KAG7100021.1 hypothetical protein E1B28_001807 [Marasmius oreades]
MSNTASRRHLVRVDQDGPWCISVAESPHDARSYSIYIKTPTHNLTLTRTAMELLDLHQKLQDTIPSAKFPAPPLDASALAGAPPKRKSAFLNTLSRLASPSASKTGRRSSLARGISNGNTAPSMPPSGLPTPAQSPSIEANDPFQSFGTSNALLTAELPPPTVQSTAIASYLTTVSNMVGVRQTRVWKRFVRVRTEDLESVRVERAIKRVRSDLTGYTGIERKEKERKEDKRDEKENMVPSSTAVPMGGAEAKDHLHTENDHKEVGSRNEQSAMDVQMEETPVLSKPDAAVTGSTTTSELKDAPITDTPGPATVPKTETSMSLPSEEEPRTPSAAVSSPSTSLASSEPAGPVRADGQRSQSADPDKRISRAFLSSATSDSNRESGMSSRSRSQTETEDDSSTHKSQKRSRWKKATGSSDALKEKKKSTRKVVVTDFEMLRVLGKGCAGKVLLVRRKTSDDLYAMKAITKRHVLAHQELQHTLTEQAVLKRMAAGVDGKERDPFVVKLWWSFHDKENLFLVMDFHPGGDLATQLARWGRLGRDRARFYAAEIVEGVEGLHAAGVIYRDLKPENILIGADGHIVLTDFGLSKEFPRRTGATSAPSTPPITRHDGTTAPWMKTTNSTDVDLAIANGVPKDMTSTFCGTAEYLAPEVIQGLPYSYEVDWWSFGTMLFEMLTGITPFWANNHSDMYVRVLQDELQFPEDRALDQDTKSLVRGLLQRNPVLRICEPRIKKHPYFSMIDWSHVYYKRYIPPYIPPIDPHNASDTQNFDDTFLDMEPVLDEYIDGQGTDTDQDPEQHTDTDRTDGEESNTTPSQSRSSSLRPRAPEQPTQEDDSVDVFDGYSFKGRHSILMDDEDEDDGSSEEETDEGEMEALEPPHTNGDVFNGLENLAEVEPESPKSDIIEETEPKTPEARPVLLPPEKGVEDIHQSPLTPPAEAPQQEEKPEQPAVEAPLTSKSETAEGTEQTTEAKSRKSKDLPTPVTNLDAVPPVTPEKEIKSKPVPPPKGIALTKANRPTRPRKERSGVPALDRYLSDAGEGQEITERDDDEDEDWDFIEADDDGYEDRNGAKGTSLFARGVVDRYRLAVFSRKASTPQRTLPRSLSGMSKDSEMSPSECGDSPSPSIRRGRNGGLTFRKHPRQFLRARSPPPSSFSAKSAKSLSYSTSATLSATSSSGLIPSSSTASTLPVSPSLKSKQSEMSVGANSHSSGNSGNGDAIEVVPDDRDKQKNKKLKKYKENAEKIRGLRDARCMAIDSDPFQEAAGCVEKALDWMNM